MQSNIIINKNLHGVLVYGTASGYRELGSLNLENSKFLDDLVDISNSFDLSNDTTIVSVTAGKDQITIFTLYSRIEDGRSRDGYYSISLFYYGLIPHSDLVFEQLFLFQKEFNKQILEHNEIQISRIDKIQNLVENIPSLPRKVQSKKLGNHFSVIQISNNISYEDINEKYLNSFINEVNWGKSLFVSKLGLLKANKIYSTKNGSFYAEDTIILDKFSAINELEKERRTKRFNFITLSNKNIVVPGTLTLKIGDRYSEHKIDNTPLPIELVLEDTAEVRLNFTPNNTIKFEKFEETKPFTQLTGYQGSTLNLKIEEKPSKKFEIKSDVPIYGIKVVCNDREIYPEQGYYTIYDQSGIIKITSTSHLPHNVEIRNISSNLSITLLSNNIELDFYDGNNKIPFSKEIELTANENRLSTNFISRSDLPIKIEVKSKKYFKNNPSIIPKDFTDSKYPIYLKNITEITGENTSKNGGKNSGIIGPDNTKSWYSTAKAKALFITLLLFFLAVSAYFILMNKEIIPNCDNIEKGTPQFEKYCKIDPTCKKCKAHPEKQKPDSVAAAQTSILKDNSIAIKDTILQSKPDEVSIPSTSERKSELINCDNVKSGTPQDGNKFCEKIVNFGCQNCPVTCKNFNKKSITEKKSFCKNVENRDCKHCKPSCTNYNHLPKETQEAYCNDPKANCDKCPIKASQNGSPIPYNGTSDDNKEKQNDCNGLDELTGINLKNACNSPKFKNCTKCKKN